MFTTSTSMHECAICLKSYKRKVHLQRHLGVHSLERLHQCPMCGSTYQRADVLKRHMRACDGSQNVALRGMGRRRACDHCVRRKKACNSLQPCQGCLKRSIECNYTSQRPTEPRLQDLPFCTFETTQEETEVTEDPILPAVDRGAEFEIGNQPIMNEDPDIFIMPLELDSFHPFTPTWKDFLEFTPRSVTPQDSFYPTAGNIGSFSFLWRFTSKTGLVPSFDCGTLEQRQQVISELDLERLSRTRTSQSIGNTYVERTAEGVPLKWLNDPLAFKAHQILLLVKEIITTKSRNSVVTLSWSDAVERMCLQFFSPDNLRKFLALYWAIWHPNVNFIHMPSFDAVSAKPSLLASMVLMGKP